MVQHFSVLPSMSILNKSSSTVDFDHVKISRYISKKINTTVGFYNKPLQGNYLQRLWTDQHSKCAKKQYDKVSDLMLQLLVTISVCRNLASSYRGVYCCDILWNVLQTNINYFSKLHNYDTNRSQKLFKETVLTITQRKWSLQTFG
jgi:hypothetical protein